jgi:CheY-like chemotaxis protein
MMQDRGPECVAMARILVIDDEQDIRRVLSRILSSAGHDVVEAEDGRTGVKQARHENPDLIITDILMPEKDGIEAIEEIRQLTKPPKIIAMSGGGRYEGFEFLEIAKCLGANALLTKPFRAAALLDVVQKVLGSGQNEPIRNG